MKKTVYISSILCALIIAISAGVLCNPSLIQQEDTPIDLEKAALYFRQAREMSERDGGKLWGIELYGPMLFVDPRTRFIVANRQNGAGTLLQKGEVYVGQLADTVSLANTSFGWHGEKWVMIMWGALSDDSCGRATSLMMHELWHSVQYELGFPGVPSLNSHLDEMKGRFLLKMEWRALAAALTSSGNKRENAAGDALLFRYARREAFPGADSTENAFEMHEGLAEYTGQRLSGLPLDEIRPMVAERLLSAGDRLSYSNSFAYYSGAGYGILLDDLGVEWRGGLTPKSDFGKILLNHYGITLPPDVESVAKDHYSAYQGESLLAEERRLEEQRQAQNRSFIKRFVEGPVLVLPNAGMRLSYNPNTIFDLGEHGTVYGYVTAIAEWGKLTAEEGALRSPDWSSLTVSAKSIQGLKFENLKGEGWTLELAPGWKVVASDDSGSYTVEKEN